MGSLERSLQASEAAPHRIVELVSQLGSDTLAAPRQLPASMISRLNSLTSPHGKVKLHGRLFAQWMHHVFPNECPFPHEAGTVSPLTPDEWIGKDVGESQKERQRIVDEDTCSADGCQPTAEELPWHDEEDLLASQPRREEDEEQIYLLSALALSALSVFSWRSASLAPLRLQVLGHAAKQGVSWQLLAVVWFSIIGFATNLVDPGLFAFVIVGGIVSNFLSRGPGCAKAMKSEKSLV